MSATDMPARPPGPMRADARRNRDLLLSTALAAFTEHGADDVSLEGIARRAGVGIGTLYRHFPTRQDLLEAVYRDQVEALCARAADLLDEPSPADALATWLRAMVAFSTTKGGRVAAGPRAAGRRDPARRRRRGHYAALARAHGGDRARTARP